MSLAGDLTNDSYSRKSRGCISAHVTNKGPRPSADLTPRPGTGTVPDLTRGTA